MLEIFFFLPQTCASTTVRTTIKARPGPLAVNMTVNVLMLALECGAVNQSKHATPYKPCLYLYQRFSFIF